MDRRSVWCRGSVEADCILTLQWDDTLIHHRQNCRLGTQLQLLEELLDEELVAGRHVEGFFDSGDEDCLLGMAIRKAIALPLGSLIRERESEKNVCFSLIYRMSCS